MTLRVSLLLVLFGISAASLKGDEAEDKIVEKIKKSGGDILRDKKKPGNPIIGVQLKGDKGMECLSHLKELPSLKWLILENAITDAGMVHLKDLKSLEQLELIRLKISDEGLAHLKGLHKLKKLYLPGGNIITDAGLVHLKGLKLTRLQLGGSKVSNEGIAELQKAMPKALITR